MIYSPDSSLTISISDTNILCKTPWTDYINHVAKYIEEISMGSSMASVIEVDAASSVAPLTGTTITSSNV